MSDKQPIQPIEPRVAAVYPGDGDDGTEVCGAAKVVRLEAREHGWKVLAVLSLLMGFASISTDVYLPAMPAMAQALGTSHGMIEWTVSGYLIGFSLGQLLWGPVSDRYGRRSPVAIGLLLFIVGSAGCAFSDNIAAIIFWRVVQATGACASVVLSRAMVRDLYEGPRAAQMMSNLITVMAIAPLIGPFVGGQILLQAGWRWIFGLLVVVGVATLAALYTLPETLSEKNRSHEPLAGSFKRYWALLQQPSMLAYIGVGGLFYGGAYAYIAGSPFAFISYHHLPPQWFGFVFALGIVGIMGCNLLNSKIVHRFGSARILVWGGAIAAVSGALLAVAGATDIGGIAGLVIPLFFFVSMNGFIVANSMAGALDDFPQNAGAVSALLGATQYGGGILASGLVGWLADGTAWPMSVVIGATGIGTFICALLVSYHTQSRTLEVLS